MQGNVAARFRTTFGRKRGNNATNAATKARLLKAFALCAKVRNLRCVLNKDTTVNKAVSMSAFYAAFITAGRNTFYLTQPFPWAVCSAQEYLTGARKIKF